jgi:calcineurin-like phosphoesterase family protein
LSIWLTADEHYNHANIIKYCSRPFKSVPEMNSIMIARMCDVVMPWDVVYHVGDFSLYGGEFEMLSSNGMKISEIVASLPGRHVFIMGNHDRGYSREPRLKEALLDAFGMQFRLVHHPEEAPKDGRYNLTGHVHGAWLEYRNEHGARCYNVGVDMHNFTPVKLDWISKFLRKSKEKP